MRRHRQHGLTEEEAYIAEAVLMDAFSEWRTRVEKAV